MKRITKLLLISIVMLCYGNASAQTARIQAIHNCADLAATTVDVYVNGTIFLDDFKFRSASPFVTVPAGVSLSIDVAPGNSTSSAQSIYNLTTTLASNETYILVANGIVSATGYAPAQPFQLSVFAQGRETASNPVNTDILVSHGSTDAPTVDVVETSVPAGTVVNNISYPSFSSGYLELPTADYTLNVTDASGSTVVASYAAPLQTLGLQGQALTVVASGFLDPSQNSNGPAFGLWVALASGGDLVQLPQITTARVQVIHNSADLAAATVDVYVNDVLALDNFAFRTATPFIDLPAGEPISLDIAPANSTSSAQSIYNLTTTLSPNATYIVVANGIVSPTGYAPSQPFQLSVFAQGRENASNPANTDILVNHGATDAPTVDVVETSVPAGTIIDNISYPSFTSDYLELPTADYTLNVTDASGSTVVASYGAPLQTLGLQGQALTVLASGFLDPTQNSNGPAFGLWVALASGGNLVQLPQITTARVQVIHNSADLAAATVDVYINDVLALDNFAFRTATPFIDLPAGAPISLDIAPGNSTSSAQSIYNLTTTLSVNERYVVIANGIVSPTGYTPAQPFQLSVFAQGRENASNPANTDILVNHGATDAPTVDVVETSVPAGTIIDNISYPSFTSDYLELPTADYTLNVTDASGSTVVASYSAPLQTLGLEGQALTVVASGFLDPTQNSNGPTFGLWAALPTGGNLVPLPPVTTARAQIIHNCADLAAASVDVYVNGVILLKDFAFRTATPFVTVPAGVSLNIDVAPGNSASSAQSIYNLTTTLSPNATYIIVANGIVSPAGYTPAQPFQLSVFAQGRENASNPANTDILVNHGSTDAPTVDVVETSVPAGTIVDNISYPSFSSDYLELPTADYTLNVTDASGSTVVASYGAPLQTLGLQGQALTVLASGFLDPTQNSNGPAFGLWAALSSGGNLVPLPTIPLAVTQFDKNQITVFPNPVSALLNVNLPQNYTKASATVTDCNGRRLMQIENLSSNPISFENLASGIYLLNINVDNTVYTKKIVVER